MPRLRQQNEQHADVALHLANDAKFMLGKIVAIVETLPPRMDRHEGEMTKSLADIRSEVMAIYAGINMRVQALEKANDKRSGALGVLAVFSTFISASISGLIVWFLGKR